MFYVAVAFMSSHRTEVTISFSVSRIDTHLAIGWKKLSQIKLAPMLRNKRREDKNYNEETNYLQGELKHCHENVFFMDVF